jgi:hypothetical protein
VRGGEGGVSKHQALPPASLESPLRVRVMVKQEMCLLFIATTLGTKRTSIFRGTGKSSRILYGKKHKWGGSTYALLSSRGQTVVWSGWSLSQVWFLKSSWF